MKNIITLLSFLTLSLSASAQGLKANVFKDLMDELKASTFTYKETGKIFGYISTQSCLHTSANMVIFKNYCFPVHNYPARSYTIISAKHGKIDLYQEQYPNFLKRDIRISQFTELLETHLPASFPNSTLDELDAMIEDMYYNYNPGCWSTNFSQYVEAPEANCSVAVENVQNFAAWASETQAIVLSETEWKLLLNTVEKKLIR